MLTFSIVSISYYSRWCPIHVLFKIRFSSFFQPRLQTPLISFLHIPSKNRARRQIDTNTPVEITCGCPESDIFFTIDGTRPEPFDKRNAKSSSSTFRFEEPILLSAGRRLVRAIAIHRHTGMVSNLVTKSVDVQEAPPNAKVHQKFNICGADDLQFLTDVKRERERVQSGCKARKVAPQAASQAISSLAKDLLMSDGSQGDRPKEQPPSHPSQPISQPSYQPKTPQNSQFSSILK